MKNENTKQTNKNTDTVILAEIVGFLVVEKTSKNGNRYKCIVAVDENDKEYFVNYAK